MDMDKTIVLLSSMSPKVKTKAYVRYSSVLALKKNIRRSSIFDKSVRSTKNVDVCMVESSEGTSSNNSDKSYKVINETPIILSDTGSSDLSDSEYQIERNKTPEKNERPINNCLLTKQKLNEINLWIDGLNEDKSHEITKYSELSTIYGDEGEHFQPKERGNAVSSTFIGSQGKRLDEFFVKSPKEVEEDSFSTKDFNESLKKLIIDDSFQNSIKEASNKDEYKQNEIEKSIEFEDNVKKSSDESFHSTKSAPTVPDVQKTPSYEAENVETEIGSLLDSIYGKTWRAKQDQILPKTEPKKNQIKCHNFTSSERKPKTSLLYKNPYLEAEQSKSDNLLKQLHHTKMKEKFESPLIQKLKVICDSDTNSETSPVVLKKTKARLVFDDSSEDETDYTGLNNKDDQNISDEQGESTNDKENFDISDLGISLEERIRKKMLNIPKTPGTTRTKKSTVKKKENVNKIKIKKKTQPLKEVPLKENPKVQKTDESTKKIFDKTDDNLLDRNGTKKSSNSSSNVSISSDDEDEWDRRISTITYKKPTSGTYSFLASLSGSVPIGKCDMSARIYRNNFKNFKDQLLAKLFGIYNEKVFDSSIPPNSQFEWNDRMRGTAGFCYCRKVTRKNGAVERSVRIVLANKVIDCAERLRDTLIHEMCHAAAWIVNCVSDGHGRYWKSWAFKAMKTFPELPPIKRCHDYVINTKYTYRCTGCGYSIGRHSKSLDIERKRCGYCLGKFEVLLNKVSKKGETKSVPATPKKEVNGFALFVKENYGSVKKSNLKHGEVMKLLGQKFQEMKVNNKN